MTREADLPALFAHQADPGARWMAAFVLSDADDLAVFVRRWQQLLADPTVDARTIDVDGAIGGSILAFLGPDGWEVSYWIAPAWWGRGVATRALGLLVDDVPHRPLRGRTAKDNAASIAVMQRAGFRVVGEERGFSPVRNEEVAECLLLLDG